MKEEQLLEALKYIRRHIELTVPKMYHLSGSWNIADRAIKEYENEHSR